MHAGDPDKEKEKSKLSGSLFAHRGVNGVTQFTEPHPSSMLAAVAVLRVNVLLEFGAKLSSGVHLSPARR